MAENKPHRKDVIRNLLESMKQAVEKKIESNGTRPTKKPRDLLPLELGIPKGGSVPDFGNEIKGDCKTIVDWVSSHAKMKNEGYHGGDYPKPSTGMVGSRNSLATANRRVGQTHIS